MTSNYRAHQRQALARTFRIVPQMMWKDLKWLFRHFTPKQWLWVYDNELYDIQHEAYEAERQEARERLFAGKHEEMKITVVDNFVYEEIPF